MMELDQMSHKEILDHLKTVEKNELLFHENIYYKDELTLNDIPDIINDLKLKQKYDL